MSEAVMLAIIAGLPATLAAVTALIVALRNSTKLEVVKQKTDGITGQLLEATRVAAFEEGRRARRKTDRRRAADEELPRAE